MPEENEIDPKEMYKVRESKLHGLGVFATVSIPDGSAIGPAFLKIGHTGKDHRDFSGTTLGRFMNHSDKPNVTLKGSKNAYQVIALRRIARFKEILLDYNAIPWDVRIPEEGE